MNTREALAGALARGEFKASISSVHVPRLSMREGEGVTTMMGKPVVRIKMTVEADVDPETWAFITRGAVRP